MAAAEALYIENILSGNNGIYVEANGAKAIHAAVINGDAIYATNSGTSGNAGYFQTTSGTGIFAQAGTGGTAGIFSKGPTSAIILSCLNDGAQALIVDAEGQVGVGTATPSTILDVFESGIKVADNTAAKIQNTAISSTLLAKKYGLQISSTGSWATGSTNTGLEVVVSGGSLNVAATFTGGNVGIGTAVPSHPLHVIGTAGLSTGTAWTNTSDARLKNVHGNYGYGLDEIMKLRTVRFNYKKDNPLNLPSENEIIGFVAQEVQEVISEAVVTRKDGYLELNVDPIHWAMLNAIQELKKEKDADMAELKAQQEIITNLQTQVQSLQLDVISINKLLRDTIIEIGESAEK
jgi:hypothetical protein